MMENESRCPCGVELRNCSMKDTEYFAKMVAESKARGVPHRICYSAASIMTPQGKD